VEEMVGVGEVRYMLHCLDVPPSRPAAHLAVPPQSLCCSVDLPLPQLSELCLLLRLHVVGGAMW
jgi:hypothetical protein